MRTRLPLALCALALLPAACPAAPVPGFLTEKAMTEPFHGIGVFLNGHLLTAVMKNGKVYLRGSGGFVPLTEKLKRYHPLIQYYGGKTPYVVVYTQDFIDALARQGRRVPQGKPVE